MIEKSRMELNGIDSNASEGVKKSPNKNLNKEVGVV
jgi:hypothetical protein